MTEAYKKYIAFLNQLELMILNGNGESFMADELRDKMDEPWFAMTDEERILARNYRYKPKENDQS